MPWGEYPAEYNPKVHGTYDPARWYGKPDTNLRDVKLGELGAWFARRQKSPNAMVAAVSRGYWRWQHNYIFPVRAGIQGYMQAVWMMMGFFYIINSGKIRKHRFYKYH